MIVNNLERKTRKSNDTSVDKEEQNSLIPKPVDYEQGNSKCDIFSFFS